MQGFLDKKMKKEIFEIKNKISMPQVVERYGYGEIRKGFILCPFHNEKTPSMKIYDKDFYCFGCGEHGDVISFVQKIFGLSFRDTVKKIDIDFGLNIFGDHTTEEICRSEFRQRAFEAKKEREKRERQKLEEEYWSAFDEWKRLDENLILYKPKLGEEIDPAFMEALEKISYQKYLLDCLERKRNSYE
jgi:DNA primase